MAVIIRNVVSTNSNFTENNANEIKFAIDELVNVITYYSNTTDISNVISSIQEMDNHLDSKVITQLTELAYSIR